MSMRIREHIFPKSQRNQEGAELRGPTWKRAK